MGFDSGGSFTPVSGAITAFPGGIVASATWNAINTGYDTALTQLGTVVLGTKGANLVFSGPTTGSAATASFRSLVAADFPALSYVGTVSMALPSMFTVTTSSVTSSNGTLTASLATQLGNLVFSSSSTGATAQPSFRALVQADIPTPAATGVGSYANVTSTSGTIVPGGTLAAGTYLVWNTGGTGTLVQGPAITGTWVNYSGATLIPNYAGLCRRTA